MSFWGGWPYHTTFNYLKPEIVNFHFAGALLDTTHTISSNDEVAAVPYLRFRNSEVRSTCLAYSWEEHVADVVTYLPLPR